MGSVYLLRGELSNSEEVSVSFTSSNETPEPLAGGRRSSRTGGWLSARTASFCAWFQVEGPPAKLPLSRWMDRGSPGALIGELGLPPLRASSGGRSAVKSPGRAHRERRCGSPDSQVFVTCLGNVISYYFKTGFESPWAEAVGSTCPLERWTVVYI